MNYIKKTILIMLMAVAVIIPISSESAAKSTTQAQQQALMAQQIVNQQVALFQAAGQTVTPEQLALLQQNANAIVAQQFAASQMQQTAGLQAQQLPVQSAAITVPNQSVPNGTAGSYVLNKNTKKFHYPTCSSASDIKPKNRADVNMSRTDIIAQGYVPCKKCNP